MKSFPFNPSNNAKCPICNTADSKDAILLPIAGTESGKNVQAIQVHMECLQKGLWYHPDIKLIIAKTTF